MTAVALSKLPAVVCPDWCTIPQEEHVADLRNWEGFVIHWSAEVGGVRHTEMAYADGPQDPSEPPQIFVEAEVMGITLDAAEALAEAILAAVKEARG